MKYSRMQFRFPVNIKEWLKKKAKKEARSMNGHLLEMLKKEKRIDETRKVEA